MRKTFLRIGVASLFAFSLGLAPMLVSATHADANTLTTEPTTNASDGINPEELGSITIHKYLTDAPSTTKATGNSTDQAPSGATPLQNVKFKITPIQLSAAINTTKGFEEAATMDVTTATSKKSSTDVREVITTEDGTVKAGNLKPGLYLVEELPSPAATPLNGKTLVPAAPFLVVLPMTNPSNRTEWNYHVHVFPKNQANAAIKAVADKDKHAGGKITYTISGDVPVVAKDNTLGAFSIVDDIDKNKLKVTEADITKVALNPAGNPAVELTKPADYTVTLSEDPKKPGKNVVTVTLTTDGLTKVQNATDGQPGFKIELTMTAEVLPVGTGDGRIVNKATVISDNGSGSGVVETPTNETTTLYGKLKIHKQKNGTTPLQGAKFELYKCDGAKKTGDPLEISTTNSWVTGPNGEVTIDGLHVTDRIDNKEVTTPSIPEKYCLVEVQAPQGFELLPEPIQIDFQSSKLGTGEVDLAMLTVTVTNIPETTVRLPMTGGPGIILLVLAGVAIIIGGTVYGIRSRKSTK